MKHIIIAACFLFSVLVYAARGEINVTKSTNRENTLDLYIYGYAAFEISNQLTSNGILFSREPFSGALIQDGDGIRCIDQHLGKDLYCYIGLKGISVK